MRLPPCPHSWEVTPKEAIEIQRRLAELVVRDGTVGWVRFVAGLDCAFSRAENRSYAAAVVWDLEESRVVETKTAFLPTTFPYVPGLLSFREIPVLLEVLGRLDATPDAIMCDGQGYAHPRRFGLASHLGVVTGLVSVGCAKSRLIGRHEEPRSERSASAPLLDGDEVIGAVLRTRASVRPLYVSIGHRLSLAGAVSLVQACGRGYRMPEPTRRADALVGRFKRESEGAVR